MSERPRTVLAMASAPKATTLHLRVSREQMTAWVEASKRASARSVAKGGPEISFSEWVRARLMDAMQRGD